ncbi:unnamed protein product [Macrosiphum euphorbiae]|uniref:Uncharacterized protein n=1 Tax=Macrosiphum euphorbiae TaxID=13131 RepID=A0AAV0VT44_9HEMI|nr:unnamed protein product [Macrosiphum euphorbiae]
MSDICGNTQCRNLAAISLSTTIVIGNYGRLHVENIRYPAPPVPSVSLSAGSPRTRHRRVSALSSVRRNFCCGNPGSRVTSGFCATDYFHVIGGPECAELRIGRGGFACFPFVVYPSVYSSPRSPVVRCTNCTHRMHAKTTCCLVIVFVCSRRFCVALCADNVRVVSSSASPTVHFTVPPVDHGKINWFNLLFVGHRGILSGQR